MELICRGAISWLGIDIIYGLYVKVTAYLDLNGIILLDQIMIVILFLQIKWPQHAEAMLHQPSLACPTKYTKTRIYQHKIFKFLIWFRRDTRHQSVEMANRSAKSTCIWYLACFYSDSSTWIKGEYIKLRQTKSNYIQTHNRSMLYCLRNYALFGFLNLFYRTSIHLWVLSENIFTK